MNLVLVGYRASGKTTIGRRLSSYLKKVFIDTDEVIEATQKASIEEIVRRYGWEYFRAIEKKVISKVAKGDDLIVSVGGGAILDADNVRALQRNGYIIWLKADVNVLWKRMIEDPLSATRRPSLTSLGRLEEFKEVFRQREPLYERVSTIQIETTELNDQEVVDQILTLLGTRWNGFHPG
mgnify:CR=1 FL=1